MFSPSLILLVSLALCGLTTCQQDTYFRLGKILYDATVDQPKSDVHVSWFKQQLDHFQPQDTRKWKQRYFTSSKFSKPTGPIFLEIGGEGAIKTDKFETS